MFSWMTKQLPLFLPSQSRTGWDWESWEAGRGGKGGRGGVNAQLPLSSAESWTPADPAPSSRRPCPLPKLSTRVFFFPADLQSHASEARFPSWKAVWSHVETNGSFAFQSVEASSMQQPAACSAWASFSWSRTQRSSPSSLCLWFSLSRQTWWR